MAYQYEYISLDDVLTKIVQQAKKDVQWMEAQIPNNIDNAQNLYLWLKSITSYEDDPKDVELIQSPKSLFLKNWYGVPGRGDCDCFSTLSICCFVAMGYPLKSINIILTGREEKIPCHIYTEIESIPFDLTNTFFGEIRNYPFFQKISIFDRWHV